MFDVPFRQVHLDFHTSPHIPDVGAHFDADEFVRTLQAAHVNSVTVFAKCHHGYSYYPTKVGMPHPHLGCDLLGEMIQACHGAGIRVPVYTTVVWDELAWATHPEWRQLSPDGHIVGPSDSPLEPGWKNLCLNTGYADRVVAQIEEILDLYDGDGLFIDIVRYAPAPCVCATCLGQMLAQGVDPEDAEQLRCFALQAERRFMARTSQAIRAKKPDQSIFYNSRLRMAWDPEWGNRPEMDAFTHLEIESLPGGLWGYDHFPLYVRYYQTFDRQLLAMTGRFHTAWGDFGGLRNREALAFECFQALAHGAACSIGDQLHPRGRLDTAVYERIGQVYAEVERREPWCAATQPLPEIGVLTANAERRLGSGGIHESDRGALHALEQLKHQFQFIDAGSDLSPYAVVTLPDEVPVDEALAARVRDYLAGGGRLLVTGRSGLDETTGDFMLAEEMGVHYAGQAEFAPDYLVLAPELAGGIEPMHHVCQLRGTRVTVEPGVQVLACSGAPYFNRTWRHFCSHRYTPMDRPTGKPVVVQNGNVVYLARPLFREYAESSRRVHRQVLANCLKRLLPRPRVGTHNLPSTAIVSVRQGGDDLLVHLLHYVHQRRGRDLDVIEDLLSLHDATVSVRATQRPSTVHLVPEEQALDWAWEDGYVRFTIPRVNGYQIVQLAGAGRA
ncbi:MAG: beta-galactosidase trimerization domain-containing protein [Anaerolineae bacterium]|nr:MAG: beta-galactosidase trimerization domain-containing protein [Anaerolineae bacterium]